MKSIEPEPYREEPVTFTGPAGKLAGTLAVPAASSPRGSIVILSGSGRNDCGGNGSRLRMNIQRDLARALSRQGFVTLRYDKRGVGQSQGNAFESGFWDLVDDAQAAVEFLKGRASGHPIPTLLLGHSEGCVIAAAVNARLPVRGAVLLAGACESLSETLSRQQAHAINELARKQQTLRRGREDREEAGHPSPLKGAPCRITEELARADTV